jgi:hypothetical protein
MTLNRFVKGLEACERLRGRGRPPRNLAGFVKKHRRVESLINNPCFLFETRSSSLNEAPFVLFRNDESKSAHTIKHFEI